MKNYFMRLIVLNIVFIVCNINAMRREPPLLEQSLDFFSETKKFEIREITNNRILIIGKFQNSKEMVQEFENIALNFHQNKDKSILLCPNMESDNINKRWVTVKRYAKISDGKGNYYSIPIEGGNTYYQGSVGILSDSRTESQLIMYTLHNRALQVINAIDNKSSIENSKEKHKQELSFMFTNKESAPVIVCINKNCFLEDQIEAICQAFQDGNVEELIKYLYVKEEENETVSKNDVKKPTIQNTELPLDTSKPSFRISPLFAIPVVLLFISYLVYKYKK